MTVVRRTTIAPDLDHHDECCLDQSHEESDNIMHENDSLTHEKDGRILNDHDDGDLFIKRVFDVYQWPKEIRNMLAGGIAGIVAKSVVAPVDRIKILYQISAAEFHFKRLPGVVGNIIREEGLTALWKGNSATLIRVFPYSGIQFMVYDRMKLFFLKRHEADTSSTMMVDKNSTTTNHTKARGNKFGLTPFESLCAGMVAGVVSVICTYPLDLTRAQLAVLKKHKNGPNKGFLGVLSDNYTERGIRGLFRGVNLTLIGILPYSGIAFALNEQSKREIQYLTGRDLTTVERMQCGAFAGLVAQTITYPIEVTRRRLQTLGLLGRSGDTALSAIGSEYGKASATKVSMTSPPNFVSIVKDLYAEQGIRGFFKGVSMNWVKGPIAFSISFTTFDIVQSLMETSVEHQQRLPR